MEATFGTVRTLIALAFMAFTLLSPTREAAAGTRVNRHDANHRYTTRAAIRDDMIARGFALEGNGPGCATMCALPD